MDYTFIFKDDYANNIKMIYEEYFTKIFLTLSDFTIFYNNFFKNDNYKCLVIEKTYNENKKPNIYWYKADIARSLGLTLFDYAFDDKKFDDLSLY